MNTMVPQSGPEPRHGTISGSAAPDFWLTSCRLSWAHPRRGTWGDVRDSNSLGSPYRRSLSGSAALCANLILECDHSCKQRGGEQLTNHRFRLQITDCRAKLRQILPVSTEQGAHGGGGWAGSAKRPPSGSWTCVRSEVMSVRRPTSAAPDLRPTAASALLPARSRNLPGPRPSCRSAGVDVGRGRGERGERAQAVGRDLRGEQVRLGDLPVDLLAVDGDLARGLEAQPDGPHRALRRRGSRCRRRCGSSPRRCG